MKCAAVVAALGLASTHAFAQAPPEEPPPEEPPAPAPPSVPVSKPPAQLDSSTTAMWHPRRHFDLQWQLLMIPERIVSLVGIPFELLLRVFEERRLDRRIAALLTFRGMTLAPRFKFSFGDGLGAGLWIKRGGLFGRHAKVRFGGLARIDRDWQVEIEYEHQLLFPGGRGLRVRAYVENDKNQRFYGIGGQSLETDRRVLASFDEGALAEVDLQGIDVYKYSGIGQLGLRRQSLSAGTSAGDLPVAVGDTVTPPPGFDESAAFVDALLVGRYNSTDTVGRPTRGLLLEASVLGRTDVTGKGLSAATFSGRSSIYLPVLPEHRVLVLSLGGSAATSLFPGDEIPLDSLPELGRKNVRGYDRERFRDRYALTASAEYRFPIYEYLASGAGLDAFAFFDAGTVWGTTAFALDPFRYSVGGGVRGAHETKLVFEGTVGWSPEGLQINLGIEKAL
ncbi:MAG: BamA/TamA family outer membrane protein [Deltaproteobacteria bacterium]|nr:BamA/TamA family outer membrane protein [Deltaproteobacteria bacterium]